jgi:hypothetical protein
VVLLAAVLLAAVDFAAVDFAAVDFAAVDLSAVAAFLVGACLTVDLIADAALAAGLAEEAPTAFCLAVGRADVLVAFTAAFRVGLRAEALALAVEAEAACPDSERRVTAATVQRQQAMQVTQALQALQA